MGIETDPKSGHDYFLHTASGESRWERARGRCCARAARAEANFNSERHRARWRSEAIAPRGFALAPANRDGGKEFCERRGCHDSRNGVRRRRRAMEGAV